MYRGHMARRIGQTRKLTSLSALYEAFADWLNVPLASLKPQCSNSSKSPIVINIDDDDEKPSPPPALFSSPPAPLLASEAKSTTQGNPHGSARSNSGSGCGGGGGGLSAQDILRSNCMPPSLKKTLLEGLSGDVNMVQPSSTSKVDFI